MATTVLLFAIIALIVTATIRGTVWMDALVVKRVLRVLFAQKIAFVIIILEYVPLVRKAGSGTFVT